MKVLTIGGHGMLGRPVVRRLLQDGIDVRVMARNPDRAAALLPASAVCVAGDLQDPRTIRSALSGCDAVYVSVETLPKARFRPETQGLANVVQALADFPRTRLIVLSALGISNPECAHASWWHLREKYEAQQIAQRSGRAWTIFEPTWFMESLPLFVKNKQLALFSTAAFSAYWVAGDDLGRMLSRLLKDGTGQEKIFAVQGHEKLSFEQAAQRFVAAYGDGLTIRRVPGWMLSAAGFFDPKAKELVSLFAICGSYDESPPSPDVWRETAEPVMRIEDYAQYVKAGGDFPQK